MADVLNETDFSANETLKNATAKPVATPEGMALAYGSLLFMALVPIFVGSFRSVRILKQQKDAGEQPETMTARDAAMFPLIASCALFGIYLFFKIFSKDYINLLLAVYFFGLGVLVLSHVLSPIFEELMPRSFPNQDYHVIVSKGRDNQREELVNYEFDRIDLVNVAFACVVGVWYLTTKHWIANNMFGLAFATNGVEFLHLGKVSTGCILMGGLFIYDIFWVFGTEVMVTVAKSFDAPIKLVFPQDVIENGPLMANNFAMLGLGDIVIPGIFIALMLRFDVSANKNRTYFYTTFGAYVFGLAVTIFVMHVFKAAQPALLYLVPLCIGAPCLVAMMKGDLKALFSYEDNPANTATTSKETASDKKDD